jgi:hypothetical protein
VFLVSTKRLLYLEKVVRVFYCNSGLTDTLNQVILVTASNSAEPEADQCEEPAAKKKKVSFKVDSTAAKHIKQDKQNQKLWEEAMGCTSDGLQVN